MRTFGSWATMAVALAALGTAAGAGPLPEGAYQVAQGSTCQSWYNMCAQRCRERLPNDKTCASDHCAPKLSTCRQSGCWQEGQQYGGGKTCGLAK